MSAYVTWLPNWYVTRLHATRDTGIDVRMGMCGTFIREELCRGWQMKRLAKGPPRCNRCERILAAGGKP